MDSPTVNHVYLAKSLHKPPIIFNATAKAELQQLNRTQFSSLGIFDSKKVGNGKT